MNTLKQLIECVNTNLQELVGSPASSLLEVCKTVRGYIKEDDFYKALESNNLKNLIVFKDNIEDMKFVFIRGSEEDTGLKKIIEIQVKMEYFNDSDLSAGGIITVISCEAVEIGDKIKDLPLDEVVVSLQITDIIGKKNKIDQEISSVKENLANLNDISLNYQIQLDELYTDLKVIKSK